MTVAEMKALRRDIAAYEFDQRIELHCKELFDLNEHGFFNGFKFIKAEFLEDAVVGDDMRDFIVYKCENRDDGYDYNITVSFDGSVMYGTCCGHKIMSIFRNARFGDKFVTDNGTVLIYGRRTKSVENRAYGKVAFVAHILMGCDGIYYVSDEGDYINYDGHIEFKVVGRLGDEDLDIVKAYVKKELSDKEDNGYMQGFIDGYNNFVID